MHVFILSLALGRFFVASDVFSCRKTVSPKPPVTITDHAKLQPGLQQGGDLAGEGQGQYFKILNPRSTRQILVLPACPVMFFSSLKKSFLLNRHLHSYSENGGWEAWLSSLSKSLLSRTSTG